MPSSSADRSAPLGEPQPLPAQQHRHDEVVADHGRERDRLHDHHAGRGGEPADEREEREQRLLLRDRQRQHEGIGVHACRTGKCSSPPSAIGSTKMLIARR